MKTTFGPLLLLCFVGAITALPARTDEVEIVPLEDQEGREPVVDIGAGGGFFSSSPFDGFLESVTSMMTRMRQQMNSLLRRIPTANSTDDNLFGFPRFPSVSDLDLGKGNTTSVTKVIDGHKVVINETEYSSGGDNEHSFFKVRIIDVRPDSSEQENSSNPDAEEITPKTPSNAEPLENTYENEIPKNNEVFSNIETFESDEEVVDGTQSSSSAVNQWDTVEPLETLEGNSVESHQPSISLAGDISVNQVMADAGAPTDPDAEVVPTVVSGQAEGKTAITPR